MVILCLRMLSLKSYRLPHSTIIEISCLVYQMQTLRNLRGNDFDVRVYIASISFAYAYVLSSYNVQFLNYLGFFLWFFSIYTISTLEFFHHLFFPDLFSPILLRNFFQLSYSLTDVRNCYSLPARQFRSIFFSSLSSFYYLKKDVVPNLSKLSVFQTMCSTTVFQ